MPGLSTAERNKLEDSQFAYIDKDGERHLPIHDEAHVRNAIQRFGQTHFESAQAKKHAAQAILKAARSHDIEVAEDDHVIQAAGR
jgi:2-hydroxychromene-2-carboxylate isomerase